MSAQLKPQFRCFREFMLADAEYVCQNASPIEMETVRIMSGLEDYDPWYALRRLMELGVSWCMYNRNTNIPFMAGGFRFITPTRVVSTTISTMNWRDSVKDVTFDCRAALRAMMDKTPVRRIECWSLGSNDPAHRWYKTIGFHHEATLEQYGPKGESVCIHAITKEAG